MSRRWFAPEVVQTSAMDCGPASLKCLLEGFGIPVSYGRLREACQTDVDGTSIDTLEEIAKRVGLDASQTMLPADHLMLRGAQVFPALIVVTTASGYTHFVILWRRAGDWLQVMDPGAGRAWLRVSDFLPTVFQHTQALPAPMWREWAGGDSHRAQLAERLANAGAGRVEADELLRRALSDTGWRGIAALDAAIRLGASLVESGAIPRRRAGAVIRAMFDSPEDIPQESWTVSRLPPGEEGEETIGWRGAVFIHVEGRSAEGVSSELPPEVAAALAEKAPPAGRVLWSIVREGGWYAPAALTLAITAAAAGTLLEGLLFRGLFDLARELGTSGQRLAAFAAAIAILLALLLLEIPISFGLPRLGRHLEARLRARFLSKIPRLGDRYFQSRPKSDMAERGHSLQSVRQLPAFVGRAARASCELAFTTAGVIWLDPGAAPAASAYLAAALLLPWLARPTLLERDMRVRTHAGGLSRFYLDSLLGLFAIRSHGAGATIRHQHRELLGEWADAALRLQRAVVSVEGAQMALGYGLGALVILDHFRRHGEASTGLLFVYWVLGLPPLAQSLVQAAWQYPAFRNTTLRTLEPLGAIEEPLPREIPAGEADGMAVRLENVSVRAGGHTILDGFDLSVAAGEQVAIVGPSGAGKSSFVGLLLGWHRPASGIVSVDGAPLDGGAGAELRRRIAWVDPEVYLWNASCIDNISYGARPEELSGIGAVVEKSELTEVLGKLPRGLQTKLGEGGAALSGGQGQRVRLGRAMLRRGARLVILDEGFRGLDHGKRVILTRRAREHWRGATMLAITHDVGSTLDFERVLVIENGRVAEDGVPAELAAREGSRYRALLDAEHEVSEGLWSGGQWRRIAIADGELKERP